MADQCLRERVITGTYHIGNYPGYRLQFVFIVSAKAKAVAASFSSFDVE